jgi:hypothetical protein
MRKPIFRVPGASTSASTNDTDSIEQNGDEYGPETEFTATCKRIFSSPNHKNTVTSNSNLPTKTKAIKTNKNDGFIVPLHQTSQKLSFDSTDSTNDDKFLILPCYLEHKL